MSLILDALNRSRLEREQMPGLSSNHLVDPVEPGVNWMQWLLVCTLALAVLVIAWLLIDKLPQPQAEAVVTVTEASPARRTQTPQPTVTPVKPTSESVAQLPAVVPTPAATPNLEATREIQENEAAPPAPSSRSLVDASVAALYEQREPERVATNPRAQQSKPRAAAREETPLDIEQLVATAEAELEDAQLTEHEVPFLSSLSQQTKDDIPTLMYQQHDYSGDPARSTVVINSKTLHSGGSAAGVKVQEILPDSVVLEVNGTRFRLRALNSWVNL